MNTSQRIPDISYHLTFCFLSLEELSSVLQCCKEWKRLVMEKSFLCMFRNNDIFQINHEIMIQLVSKNHLCCHLIREIKIFNSHEFRCYANNYPNAFHRLESIDFKIDLSHKFDVTPLFQILSPRLLKLKVSMNRFKENQTDTLDHFQNALSLLTSLTSLQIIVHMDVKFTDISFLSSMKQLKSFCCNAIYDGPIQDIIRCFASFPNLTSIRLFEYQTLNFLRELCLVSGKLKLKHLGYFIDIPKELHQECAQLLNTFTCLETIVMNVRRESIPILLGKWIHHLSFMQRKFNMTDVKHIICLSHLKSLKITRCYIGELEMITLIDGLSPRLEVLDINNCIIAIKSLSKCRKLKIIWLENVTIQLDNPSEFDLLLNCTNLESIIMQNSERKFDLLSENMKKALKIPSSVFPMLKKVSITI
jgi:hypothetical protein